MPKRWIYQKHRPDNPLSPAEQKLAAEENERLSKIARDGYIAGDPNAGEARLYNFDWSAEITAYAKNGDVYTDTVTVNAGTPFEARQYAIARAKAEFRREGKELDWATVYVVRQ